MSLIIKVHFLTSNGIPRLFVPHFQDGYVMSCVNINLKFQEILHSCRVPRILYEDRGSKSPLAAIQREITKSLSERVKDHSPVSFRCDRRPSCSPWFVTSLTSSKSDVLQVRPPTCLSDDPPSGQAKLDSTLGVYKGDLGRRRVSCHTQRRSFTQKEMEKKVR